MADPGTYEAQLERYNTMRARRAGDPEHGVPGASLSQLSDEFEMSKERARQIVTGPPPMPVGYRRTDEAAVPTTRVKERLKARIARWSKMPGEDAAERVRALEAELASLETAKAE